MRKTCIKKWIPNGVSAPGEILSGRKTACILVGTRCCASATVSALRLKSFDCQDALVAPQQRVPSTNLTFPQFELHPPLP